jgi:hypothetical protein
MITGRYINPNHIVEVDKLTFNVEVDREKNCLVIEYFDRIFLSSGAVIESKEKRLEFTDEEDIAFFEANGKISENVLRVVRNISHDYIQNNIENER